MNKMRFDTVFKKSVQVVAKTETPWNVDGNSGITYKIAILDDDVEKLKVENKEVYDSIKVGQTYVLSGYFEVRNGRYFDFKVDGFSNKQ